MFVIIVSFFLTFIFHKLASVSTMFMVNKASCVLV